MGLVEQVHGVHLSSLSCIKGNQQGGFPWVPAQSMVSLDFGFSKLLQLKKVVNELSFDLTGNLVLQDSVC